MDYVAYPRFAVYYFSGDWTAVHSYRGDGTYRENFCCKRSSVKNDSLVRAVLRVRASCASANMLVLRCPACKVGVYVHPK